MNVILPLRAEFGLKCWWHVPAVHAIPGMKTVYIEPGDQALYPSADQWIEVERQEDSLRRNRYSRDRDFVAWAASDARERFGEDVTLLKPEPSWPRERFIPKPFVHQGIGCDVVVCPRKRTYGAEKNWPHWMWLTEALKCSGLSVFAGGAPDSSYEVDAPHAWAYDRFLDATIEAVLSSRLVIATDAGLAHLAVLCGKSLIVITHADGLVAPGPSSDENGRVMDAQYWPVKKERYREANHMGSPIGFLHDAWFNPAQVHWTAIQFLNQREGKNPSGDLLEIHAPGPATYSATKGE